MKILKERHKKTTSMAEIPDHEIPEQRKTVIVGVRMDQQSRELLTWALVKVALPGDHVVALHVIPTSHASDAKTTLSVVKEFESIIAVYEGFCNLTQKDLKLKVCRGPSIRKLLVQEAKAFTASALILGIRSSSISTAKYCAKKLPINCSVVAVNNGKILYKREALSDDKEATLTHRISMKNSCIPHTSRPNSPVKGQAGMSNHPGSISTHKILSSMELSRKQSCSTCTPSSLSRCSPPVGDQEIELQEATPGWPLLRKAFLSNSEKSMGSVVQWAMRLPSRYSASIVVHPDHNNATQDTNSMVLDKTGSSPPSLVSTHDEAKKIPKQLESIPEKYSPLCRFFSYEELVLATSNFSPGCYQSLLTQFPLHELSGSLFGLCLTCTTDNMVGKGGSSRVYKGRLPSGKELAVKISRSSEDAMQEFVSEIEIITTLHHKNIISLLGFCFENNNLILVYDFLSRGSLEESLHCEKEKKSALSWIKRYNIAEGVAEALDYLHCGDDSQPIIHRDVKSSNILLSDDFVPQLCDFGLAQWASTSSTPMICNDVHGTFGYLAPEYFMYGKVNEKIDVYAFGVVLLELISGRKPVSASSPKGQESLVMWAKPILQGGKVKQLVDPSLGDDYDDNQMERMVLAASLCIRRSPRSRPRISLVLKLLRGDDDVLNWARSETGGSEEVDGLDDETESPYSNIQSHINLALLNIDDETNSVSSAEHSVDFITANTSLEQYLQGRWSRSSSFD